MSRLKLLKNRLRLDQTYQEAVVALAEGNPGALEVLLQLMKEVPRVDPENPMSWLGYFMTLDHFQIYGSKIWELYKDECGENIDTLIIVLRGIQLGIIPLGFPTAEEMEEDLALRGEITENPFPKFDFNQVFLSVMKELPNLKPNLPIQVNFK